MASNSHAWSWSSHASHAIMPSMPCRSKCHADPNAMHGQSRSHAGIDTPYHWIAQQICKPNQLTGNHRARLTCRPNASCLCGCAAAMFLCSSSWTLVMIWMTTQGEVMVRSGSSSPMDYWSPLMLRCACWLGSTSSTY